MLSRIFKMTNVFGGSSESSEERLRRNIIRHEAQIGGRLFGPVPPGVRREFFCLDERNWVWFEEWKEKGKLKSRTTRYNIRDNGIVKSQDGRAYRMVSSVEAKRLVDAARNYQKHVEAEVYSPILNSL